jgi:plasmid stabilization system protein ParE
MTQKVIFRQRALLAIADAVDWYNSQGEGLGERFVEAVEQAAAKIESNPYQYQKITGEFRRVALQVFPYNLVYRIIESEIIVLTCVHNRRDLRRMGFD